jgi:hypothetical protein
MQLSAHGRSVHTERPSNGSKRIAVSVSTGGFKDVGLTHLPRVHPTWDVAPFEVRGDGPRVNAEVRREVGERTPSPVADCEPFDLGVVQPPLDRPSMRLNPRGVSPGAGGIGGGWVSHQGERRV